MRKLLALLLLASSVFAQQQVQPVAGVLTLNLVPGTSSFKVILSANVTSVAIQNPTPGTIISVIFTENATGGFTVTFGGNITSSCTISTTANATTICQFVFDATSNQWTSVGGAGSTAVASLPGGSQIYVAASCPIGATNCFAVNKDATWVIDATFNSTTTVTTSAGDVPFACPGSNFPCSSGGDAGKIAFGNTNCSFGTAVGCASYACPQTTIATVVSAHNVTLASACTANSSGALSVFVWGHDDGAQLVAATNAMLALQTAKSGVPINLSLPCGAMMTSVNPFIGNQISIPMSFSITGCGSGTVIVPLPKMNCNVAAGHGCLIDFPIATYATFGVTPAGVIRDITFYGGGQQLHDSAATVGANASGILVNFQYGLDNVWVIGWLGGDTVIGISNTGGAMWNSGEFAGGGFGCHLQGGTNTTATMHGGTCGGSGGVGMTISQTSVAVDETDLFGVYFQNGQAGAGPLIIASGTARIYGGTMFGSANVNGGTAYFDGVAFNSGGLFIQTGTPIVHLHNCSFPNANLQQTAGNVFDDGGNNLPFSSFTTFTAGNPHGTSSVSGIADVAGNHVLSAGWGNGPATVTAVGGDTLSVSFTVNSIGTGQAASPTITDTFALGGGGFWKAPNTGCTLQQTGGTFGVITNPVPSALSRTGVVWTFSGTPVAGQSYTFVRTCS